MPRRSLLPLAGLLCVSLAAAPARADGPQAGLIETKAPSVVSVKMVVKISGGGYDREFSQTTSGVVVDAAGLVAIQWGSTGRGDVKVTPSGIRIIFPGDEKEYDGILGAVDTKYGLGYLLIKDLGERKAQPLDLSKTVEPKTGDTLYAVTRLGQGFDYAPICRRVIVSGQVTKPRVMWAIEGEGRSVGHPLYTADGAVAGMMVNQEGVGEDSRSLTFLLPLKVATGSIERSLKAAQKELEEVKTREAEAAAKAKEAESKPPDAPATPEKPPEPAPAPGDGPPK